MRTFLVLLAGALFASALGAQVCKISAAGLNRDRRVLGPVNTECGGIHSAPFGNWGVTSNFGRILDAGQFQGWCHESEVQFNGEGETPKVVCGSSHYQWNSCTSHEKYSAPNCTLYNAADCTEQHTTTGVNVLGTVEIWEPVGCPVDADNDGLADYGGCADIDSFEHGDNFMSVYELDPFTGDQLVQTLYYPRAPVALDCDVSGCSPNGSRWVTPSRYADPGGDALIFAELAVAVNGGVFDSLGQCPQAPVAPVATVSAAGYQGEVLAGGSIATVFGKELAGRSQIAITRPLPTLLAGVGVEIFDAARNRFAAPLLFVSPGQVNFLIPDGVADGPARIDVRDPNLRLVASGRIHFARTAPGLFSADSSGAGAAAALAVHAEADGSRRTEPAFACDTEGCRERAVRMGPDDAITLFGVGVRGRLDPQQVDVTFNDELGVTLYAGEQGEFEGLDQINVRPPVGVTGAVDVVVTIAGRDSNRVTLLFE